MPAGVMENGIAPQSAAAILEKITTIPDVALSLESGDGLFQIFTYRNGIRTMLKAAGVDPREAVYFGDDNDDIEPIRNCGLGVARYIERNLLQN